MNITNCSNCGGVLDRTGLCPYCGTTYKKINNIEQFIQTSNGKVTYSSEIDINISFVDQNNNVFILPVSGKFSDISINQDSVICYSGPGDKLLSFHGSSLKIYMNFEGYLRKE